MGRKKEPVGAILQGELQAALNSAFDDLAQLFLVRNFALVFLPACVSSHASTDLPNWWHCTARQLRTDCKVPPVKAQAPCVLHSRKWTFFSELDDAKLVLTALISTIEIISVLREYRASLLASIV